MVFGRVFGKVFGWFLEGFLGLKNLGVASCDGLFKFWSTNPPVGVLVFAENSYTYFGSSSSALVLDKSRHDAVGEGYKPDRAWVWQGDTVAHKADQGQKR